MENTNHFISMLINYYLRYKPKEYVFEGQFGGEVLGEKYRYGIEERRKSSRDQEKYQSAYASP